MQQHLIRAMIGTPVIRVPIASLRAGGLAWDELTAGELMFERFQGKHGKRYLEEALRQQRTLECNEQVISEIADAAQIQNYKINDVLIYEGSADNRIAFIVSGSVQVRIKDNPIVRRQAGQHVGELSVIDAKARRSASVIALDSTVVAWVEEPAFKAIADRFPYLWRTLAVEIADRLRQRADLVSRRNERPQLFIGSSSEGLPVARAIERSFSNDPIEVMIWTNNIFGASQTTIESLEEVAKKTDFAILVFTADDSIESRGTKRAAPRDNVIFELGLFMGASSRKRTFMLLEREKGIKFPNDLNGVTYLSFSRTKKSLRAKDLQRISEEIRGKIMDLEPK